MTNHPNRSPRGTSRGFTVTYRSAQVHNRRLTAGTFPTYEEARKTATGYACAPWHGSCSDVLINGREFDPLPRSERAWEK